MSLVRINKDPSRKELNIFGLSWLIFFGLVGWWVHHKFGSMPAAVTLWVIAVVVPMIGFAVPPVMKMAFFVISYLAWPIGFVLSFVILMTVYYLVVTPLGLIMRLFGYDPMSKRLKPESPTYWIERDVAGEAKSYFRQF